VSAIILAVDEPITGDALHRDGATGCRADLSKCLTHDLWEELGNQIHPIPETRSAWPMCWRRKLAPRIAERRRTPANSDSMAAAS